jgi:hypothetical protein
MTITETQTPQVSDYVGAVDVARRHQILRF